MPRIRESRWRTLWAGSVAILAIILSPGEGAFWAPSALAIEEKCPEKSVDDEGEFGLAGQVGVRPHVRRPTNATARAFRRPTSGVRGERPSAPRLGPCTALRNRAGAPLRI
jgi:hypothetical protein